MGKGAQAKLSETRRERDRAGSRRGDPLRETCRDGPDLKDKRVQGKNKTDRDILQGIRAHGYRARAFPSS